MIFQFIIIKSPRLFIYIFDTVSIHVHFSPIGWFGLDF